MNPVFQRNFNNGIKIQIEQVGRCERDDSNLMEAIGGIFIPSIVNTQHIKSEFIWGRNLKILDECLYSTWGCQSTKEQGVYRVKYEIFKGANWKILFSKIERVLILEVQKIMNVEKERKQALLDADN